MTEQNNTPPPEQQPEQTNTPRPKRKKRTYIIAGIAIAALVGIGATMDDDNDDEQDAAQTSSTATGTNSDKVKDDDKAKDDKAKDDDKDTGDDKIGARVMCESAVEDQLKSPDSAKFPSLMNNDIDDLVSFDDDNGVYTVTEYVDAENSFGASLRTTYTCEIKDAGGDDWTVVSISGLDS